MGANAPARKVFISPLDHGYEQAVADGFAWTGLEDLLKGSPRVAIKPNLTYPEYRPGVMTSLGAIEGLALYLKRFTPNITVCESDSGGYNRFPMDDVFRKTGLQAMAERLNLRVVNMSFEPSREISFRCGLRRLRVPLPSFLLDHTDLFISMPVPKVHLNTGVSFALKNQWGVIQEPALRLKLHPYFNEVVYQVNKAMPRSIVVMDGTYGLTRSGPLRGEPVRLDWLMVAEDVFISDCVAAGLVGYDPMKIPHIRHALVKEGLVPPPEVSCNVPLSGVSGTKFHLKREWTDYPGVMCFNSRILAWIGYESPLAKLLHWLLYRFREPFY